jgi:hypothetical protein
MRRFNWRALPDPRNRRVVSTKVSTVLSTGTVLSSQQRRMSELRNLVLYFRPLARPGRPEPGPSPRPDARHSQGLGQKDLAKDIADPLADPLFHFILSRYLYVDPPRDPALVSSLLLSPIDVRNMPVFSVGR